MKQVVGNFGGCVLHVSSDGGVYKGTRRLKPRWKGDRATVIVCQPDRRKREFPLARLLASALTGKDYFDKSWVANHIDNDPTNNSFGNLEAVTQKENIAHCHQYKRAAVGERCGRAKLSDADVVEIRALLTVFTPKELVRAGLSKGVTLRTIQSIHFGETRNGHRVIRASQPKGLRYA